MKLLTNKAEHVSPLASFTNANASKKKEIYTKALRAATKDQLDMMEKGRKLLAEQSRV